MTNREQALVLTDKICEILKDFPNRSVFEASKLMPEWHKYMNLWRDELFY